MEAKRKLIADRRTKDSSKQKLLKSKQKMAKKVIEDRKQQLINRLHQKEEHVAKMRADHESEMEKKRIDKALRMQQRVENVARAKRRRVPKPSHDQENEDVFGANEPNERNQGGDTGRQGCKAKAEIIERHKWRDNTILQRNILPGPGEYL